MVGGVAPFRTEHPIHGSGSQSMEGRGFRLVEDISGVGDAKIRQGLVFTKEQDYTGISGAITDNGL